MSDGAATVARWPVVLGLALALLGLLGWNLLTHPLWTAPSRDPAWYTWRANVVLEGDPARLAVPWGPPGVFAGGYRVTTPLTGALLQRVAGVDPFTFTALLFVAVPVLTGLFLGAAAHRSGAGPIAVPATMIGSVAIFLTKPFIGYLDDGVAIMLIALAIAFGVRADRSAGARVGTSLACALAALTHPTTCVLFAISLAAMAGWHLVTSRWQLREVARRDGPLLASVACGLTLGLASWRGVWGPAAPLAAAAVAPPYTKAFYLERLGVWMASLPLLVLAPLVLAAVATTALASLRSRRRAPRYASVALWWLLPIAGVLTFVIAGPDAAREGALVVPYYRFLNATGGPIAGVGLGAAAVITWALGRRGRLRPAGVLVAVVVVGALCWTVARGLGNEGGEHWANAEVRVALAAVHELAETAGERPIVLVMDHGRDSLGGGANRVYGWAKSATNAFRIGLPGGADARSATYVGTVEGFVAGEPTTGRTTTYDAVSRRFFLDVQARRRVFPGAPLVFVWSEFYRAPVDPALATAVTPTVWVVHGPGLFDPPADALERAREAAESERASIAHPAGPFADPGHLLVVIAGLLALVVVPGALGAPLFEIDDDASRVALVPGLSIALTLSSGVAVLAVWRGALSGPKALVVVFVACAVGLGLRLVAARRAASAGGSASRRLVE